MVELFTSKNYSNKQNPMKIGWIYAYGRVTLTVQVLLGSQKFQLKLFQIFKQKKKQQKYRVHNIHSTKSGTGRTCMYWCQFFIPSVNYYPWGVCLRGSNRKLQFFIFKSVHVWWRESVCLLECVHTEFDWEVERGIENSVCK